MTKHTELNKLQKAIDKVNVDVAEMYKTIDKLEGMRAELEIAKQKVDSERVEMLRDSKKMDAIEYLNKKQLITDYNKQINKINADISELKDNAEGVEVDLNSQVYAEYFDSQRIQDEFDNNVLELQKEAFQLLCQIEKVMDKIEAEGKKYYNVTRQLNHMKAKYHAFETVGKINKLMKRFGLRDNRIKYSTVVSHDLEDFEI